MNKDVRTITTWLIHGVHSAPPSVIDAAKRLTTKKKAPARPRAPVNRTRQAEKESASERRRRVYAEVDARSQHRCETFTDSGLFACPNPATDHDHFWGRGKEKETVETVWHLCKWHHDRKTENLPGRRFWIHRFAYHCRKRGYEEQVAKCNGALALEAAQHPEARSAVRGTP